MEAEGEDPIPYSQVQETFKNLVKCRFLERLPSDMSASTSDAPTAAAIMLSQELRFAVPNVSVAQIVSEKKRKRSGEADDEQGSSGNTE